MDNDEQIRILQARVTLLEAALTAESAERQHEQRVVSVPVDYASSSTNGNDFIQQLLDSLRAQGIKPPGFLQP